MDKNSDPSSEENVSNSDTLTEQALVSELEHVDRCGKAETSPDKEDEKVLQRLVDQSRDLQISTSTERCGDTETLVDEMQSIVYRTREKEQGISVCPPLPDKFKYHTHRLASCDIDSQACDDTEAMGDQEVSIIDNMEGVVSRKEDSLSVYTPTANEVGSLCDSLVSCDIDPEQAKDITVCVEGLDVSSSSNKEAIESLVPAYEEVRLGEEAEMQEGPESVLPICAADESLNESNCMNGVSGVVCCKKDELTFLHDSHEANSLGVVAEAEYTETEGVTHPDKTCFITHGVLLDSHDKALKDKSEQCDASLEGDFKGNKSEGTTDTVGTSNKPESCILMSLQTAPQEAEGNAQAGASENLVLEEPSLVVHGERDIAEEDNASVADDGGLCEAMIETDKSSASPARSTDVDAECSQDVSQAHQEAESSECQHHGDMANKDGSSSLDSTAGSGWKPQAMDGGNGTEDEDANSTGDGEDFSKSPSFLQPAVQQRKKININHQFVREIVKIQHGREQHDREQAERQILAQKAANGVQFRQSSDIKEHKASMQDRKQRTDTTKVHMQSGANDADGPTKESQQKHATRAAKMALPVQTTKVGSSQEAMGGREHGKGGGGKQRSSMSIYQPPIVRDSLARNVGEFDTSRHQSGTYAVSTSPESATSSSSKRPDFPYMGSPDESLPKLGRSSSSGDVHAHDLEEAKTEQGMSIKVTFDTERKLRHIEFSEGFLDSNQGEQGNPAASRRKWDHGLSKCPPSRTTKPAFQAFRSSSGGPIINNKQAGFDETPPKVNDPYLTQATRNSSSRLQATISRAERNNSWSQAAQGVISTTQGSPKDSADRHSWLQGSFTGESGPKLGNALERKTSFFEQADKGAFPHSSSGGRLQNSPTLIDARGTMDDRRGQVDVARQSEGHAGDIRMPSTLLQGFSMANSHRVGPPYQGNFPPATNSFPAFGRSEDPTNFSSQLRGSFESQPFNLSRSQQDDKGKKKATMSFRGGKYRKEPHARSGVKDSGSPFQVMMRDPPNNRPQVPISSVTSQTSSYPQEDFQQTYGLAWNVDDHSHNTLKRSQSESLRKASTQGLQVQLPSKETLFTTMPMHEKWGDIVDDSPDAFDYIHHKAEAQRDGTSASVFYGANSHSTTMFVDAVSSRGDTPLYKGNKQDMGPPKYGDGFVQNQPAGYGTPVRKSVFERLGAEGIFKESILGPPPGGVLKPSPGSFMSNSQTMRFQGYGPYHGSPQMSQNLSSTMHDCGGSNTTEEGQGVVVKAYTQMKEKRSKRELYVPRRGL